MSRYKIQIQSGDGWLDLRASENGRDFEPCVYPTRMKAVRALEQWNELCEHLERLRIVPMNTPECAALA